MGAIYKFLIICTQNIFCRVIFDYFQYTVQKNIATHKENHPQHLPYSSCLHHFKIEMIKKYLKKTVKSHIQRVFFFYNYLVSRTPH